MKYQADYFPELVHDRLISFAYAWTYQIQEAEWIRLFACVDDAMKKSFPRCKYLVMFKLPEKIPEDKFIKYQSLLIFEYAHSGNNSFLGDSFTCVYRTSPSFNFQEEWEFSCIRSINELPIIIDEQRYWTLYDESVEPAVPKAVSGRSGYDDMLRVQEAARKIVALEPDIPKAQLIKRPEIQDVIHHGPYSYNTLIRWIKGIAKGKGPGAPKKEQ